MHRRSWTESGIRWRIERYSAARRGSFRTNGAECGGRGEIATGLTKIERAYGRCLRRQHANAAGERDEGGVDRRARLAHAAFALARRGVMHRTHLPRQ